MTEHTTASYMTMPPVPQVSAESAVLNALATPPSVEGENKSGESNRGWGWGERRRLRREAREAEAQAREAANIIKTAQETSATKADSQVEMQRLREVVEELWAEKKVSAAAAKNEAEDRVGAALLNRSSY